MIDSIGTLEANVFGDLVLMQGNIVHVKPNKLNCGNFLMHFSIMFFDKSCIQSPVLEQ